MAQRWPKSERLRDWQSRLAENVSDREQVAVLTGDSHPVSKVHDFVAQVRWPEDAKSARIKLTVKGVDGADDRERTVIWRNPRLRFRGIDRQWRDDQPR